METKGVIEDAIRWGAATIAYHCAFTNRRTLAITVHPDLRVTVSAPIGASREAIRRKVLKRAAWIQRTTQELELYLPAQPPRRYVSGETHRYLGRQYRLRVRPGAASRVRLLRGYLSVVCLHPERPEVVRELVLAWYLAQARRVFADRLSACHARVRPRETQIPAVAVRRLAKRWGSCTRGGRITLNLELIKAPRDCIDYVIVHELSHLDEPHHGPRFWRRLDRVMPDWRQRRALLNRMADV